MSIGTHRCTLAVLISNVHLVLVTRFILILIRLSHPDILASSWYTCLILIRSPHPDSFALLLFPITPFFHFLVTCLILIHSPQPDDLNLYSMPKYDNPFHPRLSFIFVLVCQLCLSRFDFTAHIWRPQIPSLHDHLCASLALNCHQNRNYLLV